MAAMRASASEFDAQPLAHVPGECQWSCGLLRKRDNFDFQQCSQACSTEPELRKSAHAGFQLPGGRTVAVIASGPSHSPTPDTVLPAHHSPAFN
jgi:hypothetical protein